LPSSVTGHGTNVIQASRSRLNRQRCRPRHHWRIIFTSQLAGLFGTAIAVTTMLGLAGMVVALDALDR